MDLPGGFSLETYAGICAALAEGDRTLPQVLESFDVKEEAWTEGQVLWARALAEDEMEGLGQGLADAYGQAYARAQDALKPLPQLTPEQWAAVQHDAARDGIAGLAVHAVTEADYARLSRHWIATLASDRELAARYNAALYARHPTSTG